MPRPKPTWPRQQLQDPPGAGADVEQVGGPILGEQVVQLGLDQGRVDRERPLAVPGLGPLGEEPLGLAAPRLAHRLEPPLVVTHGRIVAGQEPAQRAGDPGTIAVLGAPIEHPAALAEPVEQARLGQDLEMARDARLALPHDLDQLAHGPLALRADREQPQARRIAGGAEAVEQSVEGCRFLAIPTVSNA